MHRLFNLFFNFFYQASLHCLDAVPVVTNIHTTVFRGACVLLTAKRFMQCISCTFFFVEENKAFLVHINFITIPVSVCKTPL